VLKKNLSIADQKNSSGAMLAPMLRATGAFNPPISIARSHKFPSVYLAKAIE
jgi:hypothetical protein